MISLKWHSPKPDIIDIDEIVKADIEKSLGDVDSPSDLLFHTVFLVDYDGPVVHVWGEDGDDDYYHCEYDPKPVWETLKPKEDDDLTFEMPKRFKDAGQE